MNSDGSVPREDPTPEWPAWKVAVASLWPVVALAAYLGHVVARFWALLFG